MRDERRADAGPDLDRVLAQSVGRAQRAHDARRGVGQRRRVGDAVQESAELVAAQASPQVAVAQREP